MLKKLITIALTSGLAAMFMDMLLRRAEESTRLQTARDRKLELQRWEDEGGLVP